MSFALCGATLLAETPDLPVRVVNGKEYYYYEVPSKATIYSISKKFNYTRDEILKYNPQVRDGLRAGDVLLFPVAAVAEVEEIEPVEEAAVEEATEEAVEEVVEEVAEETVEEAAEAVEEPVAVAAVAPVVPVLSIATVEPSESDNLNVAVMLPFMLNAENMTRQAENQTNFYRGMLLAVNDLAANSGFNINLNVFDTECSADVVKAQLNRPEFAEMDYIIAPGDSLCLEYIAGRADRGASTVVNLFAAKNESHLRHESIVQGNIPSDDMYKRAIEAFCSEFAGRKAIILNPTDLHADKADFIDDLTKSMVAAGIPYEEIKFTGRLAPELLAELPQGNYIFVPTGSTREILMRIIPTLVAYKNASVAHDIRLFGYPVWVTMRGEIKDNLHKLNTMIYSRFSSELDDSNVKRVSDEYRQWFGCDMPSEVPSTVLLGYDTMAWILSAASNGLTEPYEGLQNSFKVKGIDGAGNVNTGLYFITFGTDGKVGAKSL